KFQINEILLYLTKFDASVRLGNVVDGLGIVGDLTPQPKLGIVIGAEQTVLPEAVFFYGLHPQGGCGLGFGPGHDILQRKADLVLPKSDERIKRKEKCNTKNSKSIHI